MASLTPVTHLGLVAEDDDLLAACLLDDLSADYRAVDARRSDARLAVAIAADEQYAFEVKRLAWLARQPLHGDSVAWPDRVLLATRFDNGVHSLLNPPPTLRLLESRTTRRRGRWRAAARRVYKVSAWRFRALRQRWQILQLLESEVLQALGCGGQ